MGDGSLWNFINNQTDHDIIFARNLLEGKEAKITGFLYPMAHMIEIISIKVKSITEDQIQKAALHEDTIIGNALLERKMGEAPVIGHYHELEDADTHK